MSNPYLNTPSTKLKRDIPKAKGKAKKQMQEALEAWRLTVPGPFRRGSTTIRGTEGGSEGFGLEGRAWRSS
jgi:hypothetical protein